MRRWCTRPLASGSTATRRRWRPPGSAIDPELIAEGDFDAASGHRAMAALLAKSTIDAAFVASDVVALGAFGALREAGFRVPGRRVDRRLR